MFYHPGGRAGTILFSVGLGIWGNGKSGFAFLTTCVRNRPLLKKSVTSDKNFTFRGRVWSGLCLGVLRKDGDSRGEGGGESVFAGNLVRREKFLNIVGRTACPEKKEINSSWEIRAALRNGGDLFLVQEFC